MKRFLNMLKIYWEEESTMKNNLSMVSNVFATVCNSLQTASGSDFHKNDHEKQMFSEENSCIVLQAEYDSFVLSLHLSKHDFLYINLDRCKTHAKTHSVHWPSYRLASFIIIFFMTVRESFEKTKSEFAERWIDLKYWIGSDPWYYYEPTIVTFWRDMFWRIDHERDTVQFIIHHIQ